MKGQSAIEYLMTYGWMLLAVAVVGGAVFSVVQSQSVESVSGFTGDDVIIDDFGATSSGNLQLELRNAAANSVTVNSINVSDSNGFSEWLGSETFSVGETGLFTLNNISESQESGSNSLDVTINYDSRGLTNLEVSGTITGNFDINKMPSTTGNGNSESSTSIVDDFEDSDLSEYSGDIGSFNIESSVVKSDNYSLSGPDSSQTLVTSTTGLENYPRRGDIVTWWQRNGGGELIFLGNSSDDFYQATMLVNNNEIRIRKTAGGSSNNVDLNTSSVPLSSDTWYFNELQLARDGSGNMTFRVYDQKPENGGTMLGSVKASDSEYGAGILGFRQGNNNGAYWDDVKVR